MTLAYSPAQSLIQLALVIKLSFRGSGCVHCGFDLQRESLFERLIQAVNARAYKVGPVLISTFFTVIVTYTFVFALKCAYGETRPFPTGCVGSADVFKIRFSLVP